MTYKFGDMIDFPKTEQKRVHIGDNEFLNLSVRNEMTKLEFAKCTELFGENKGPIGDVGNWHSNPNWLNYYNKRTLYSSEFHLQNYARQHNFASNGKAGGDRLLCYLGDSTTYDAIIGNYDDLFIHYNLPAEMYSVMYYSPTDEWFFGETGKIHTISDANLKASGSLTQIATTPVSGFTHGVLVLYHVKKTGTIIHTSYSNEIARSTDHGVTWTDVGATINGRGRGIAEDAAGNLVLITSSADSYKSTDDGVTWTKITADTSTGTNNFYVACNQSTGRFMISGDGTNLYTMDDITSNKKLLCTFPYKVHNVQFFKGAWYVTQDANGKEMTEPAGYMSFDDGGTWLPVSIEFFGFIYNSGGATWAYNDNDEYMVISARYLDAMTVVSANDGNFITPPRYYSDDPGKVKLFCVR